MIAQIPRVGLGEFPTPLTECPRLSATLGGPQIYIKREDLSGLGLGGNKSRLLEFRMAEALALGADVVVAGLEEHSNSARQLTAAANRLGLRTRLLLQSAGEPAWQGNLLIDHILGAEISFLGHLNTDMDQELRVIADREQSTGATPYIMNHARFFGIGASLAGLEWTIEACEQLQARGKTPTHFYVSSGGKCQSGMVIAQQCLADSFRVVALNANPAFHEAVSATIRIAKETLSVLGLDIRLSSDMVTSRLDTAGPRFGAPTPEAIDAIQLVAKTEGILLDPVFSGKAMAGLISDIRLAKCRDDDVVVFVHTGGVPALFSHASAFTETL